LDGTLLQGPDPTQIGLPASLGVVVGMADIVAHPGLFAANIANVGHDGCSFLQIFYFTLNLKKAKECGKKISSGSARSFCCGPS
jgi:hypothetical protein